MGFFYKVAFFTRLQLYNKMTLAGRVPVNFGKALRFLTEHAKAITFLPYGFYEILPVDLAQAYEYGIPEKWDL